MKKFFSILGGIFAVLIVAAVVGFFLLNHFGTAFDDESNSYVDSNLPQILENWDPEELINRASPELMAIAPNETIEQLFYVLSERLGPLKEYKGSTGESNIYATTDIGNLITITGAYVAEASFEKGSASIKFHLIKHGDNWQVIEFRVNPDDD